MTESEFRERLDLIRRSPPDANDKLDLVISLLRAILLSNVSIAGSWIKNYEPPDLKACYPDWRRKRKSGTAFVMAPKEVLAVFRSFKRRR